MKMLWRFYMSFHNSFRPALVLLVYKELVSWVSVQRYLLLWPFLSSWCYRHQWSRRIRQMFGWYGGVMLQGLLSVETSMSYRCRWWWWPATFCSVCSVFPNSSNEWDWRAAAPLPTTLDSRWVVFGWYCTERMTDQNGSESRGQINVGCEQVSKFIHVDYNSVHKIRDFRFRSGRNTFFEEPLKSKLRGTVQSPIWSLKSTHFLSKVDIFRPCCAIHEGLDSPSKSYVVLQCTDLAERNR